MTPQSYVALAMRTNRDMGTERDIIHGAMLVSSEAGEVVSEVKRMFAYGKTLDVEHVKEELGGTSCGASHCCATPSVSTSKT